MNGDLKEAPLRDGGDGLVPDGYGWYIVNVADAQGMHTEAFGDGCRFENPAHLFPDFGFNVRVLQPGQPNSLYHRENGQEVFLVISGECVAIVEGEERPMRSGDFLYASPGAAHILVGAGDGPCVAVMAGARKQPREISYPVSEAATRHGASARIETSDPAVAYAGQTPPEPARLGMPW